MDSSHNGGLAVGGAGNSVATVPDGTERPVVRGVCAVICGTLAAGACLHALAAALAIVVAISMITIALLGTTAGTVVLGLGAAGVIAVAVTCAVNRRR